MYRARDTTLGRDVAIKVLSQPFTSDPERLARFEREARVLASLNHPAIGAIYGLERASTGGQRPAMPALVLELVEGDTLADRIRRGPVPAAAALGPYPVTLWLMCRNIETLANFQPPATEEEIKASALQFVRKLSGTTRPSRANQAVFDQAVEDVTAAAEALIRSLTTTAAPRNREEEAQRAKERSAKRFPEAARRERQAG